MIAGNWEVEVMERIISRYLSWLGLLVIGILVYLVTLNWRLFSVALAVTGIIAVVLAVLADNAGERGNNADKLIG